MKTSIVSITSLAVLFLIPLVATAGQNNDDDRNERTTKLPVGNYEERSLLPTGQFITPTATPGSTIQVLATGLRADGNADASEAVNIAGNADGHGLSLHMSAFHSTGQKNLSSLSFRRDVRHVLTTSSEGLD
jgi:hypothetical protein